MCLCLHWTVMFHIIIFEKRRKTSIFLSLTTPITNSTSFPRKEHYHSEGTHSVYLWWVTSRHCWGKGGLHQSHVLDRLVRVEEEFHPLLNWGKHLKTTLPGFRGGLRFPVSAETRLRSLHHLGLPCVSACPSHVLQAADCDKLALCSSPGSCDRLFWIQAREGSKDC